jgi:hypothetical protein
MDYLAYKHPSRKFLKIVATKAIENFEDIDLPGLLVFQDGELKEKFLPASKIFGGKKMNADCKLSYLNIEGVEFVLAVHNIMDTEVLDDPRKDLFKTRVTIKKRKDEDASDSEDDDREYLATNIKRYKF